MFVAKECRTVIWQGDRRIYVGRFCINEIEELCNDNGNRIIIVKDIISSIFEQLWNGVQEYNCYYYSAYYLRRVGITIVAIFESWQIIIIIIIGTCPCYWCHLIHRLGINGTSRIDLYTTRSKDNSGSVLALYCTRDGRIEEKTNEDTLSRLKSYWWGRNHWNTCVREEFRKQGTNIATWICSRYGRLLIVVIVVLHACITTSKVRFSFGDAKIANALDILWDFLLLREFAILRAVIITAFPSCVQLWQ